LSRLLRSVFFIGRYLLALIVFCQRLIILWFASLIVAHHSERTFLTLFFLPVRCINLPPIFFVSHYYSSTFCVSSFRDPSFSPPSSSKLVNNRRQILLNIPFTRTSTFKLGTPDTSFKSLGDFVLGEIYLFNMQDAHFSFLQR